MNRAEDLARVIAGLRGDAPRLPPVQQWQPSRCADIDIRIDRDGHWYHEGAKIRRPAMVRLFSTILRRDEDDAFYLVTPVEKLRIQVEDAPFLAVALTAGGSATDPVLCFSTNVDDRVIVDAAHPIRVETRADGQPRPYLRVRDRLDALITRSVYYELVDRAECVEGDGASELVIRSAGTSFSLGRV